MIAAGSGRFSVRGVGRCAPLLATVVIATGCSGGSDAPATTDGGLTGGPLAELLGQDIAPSERRARDVRVQELIADCMRSDGWEYEPVDPSAASMHLDEFDRQLTDPVGYGEDHGYGVVRSYDLGLEQVGLVVADPNIEYVGSLDDDDRQAYDTRLYGAPDGVTSDLPLGEQGCAGSAEAQVYGDVLLLDDDVAVRLDELTGAAGIDPALLAAHEVWSTCMRERDETYDWTTPDEIYASLSAELSAARGLGAGTGVDDDPAASGTLPDVDAAAIDDLREEELQIWSDDQRCQAVADVPAIRRRLEQQIVDQLILDFPELGVR